MVSMECLLHSNTRALNHRWRANTALQLTAARARSVLFEMLLLARARQLNATPLGVRGA